MLCHNLWILFFKYILPYQKKKRRKLGLAIIATFSSLLVVFTVLAYISSLHEMVENCPGMHSDLQSGVMGRISQWTLNAAGLLVMAFAYYSTFLPAFRVQGHFRAFP